MAYELFSGERAFDDLEREKLRAGEAVPLPERGRWASVPARLRAEVERSLAVDPADRHADAAEFAEALATGGESYPSPEAAGEETALFGGGDATLLHPLPAAVPGRREEAVAAGAGPRETAVRVESEPPVMGDAAEVGGSREVAPAGLRMRSPMMRVLLAAAAVLLVVVALIQLRSEAPAPLPEDDPVAETMRTFRPLLVEASLELADDG
jgi:hypothetical protein